MLAVLLARLERVLNREHRLEGGDRDRELGQVGLPGGEALELHARPHQHPGPRLGAVAAEPLDQLEGEPSHQRDTDHPGDEEPQERQLAERREDHDGHHHHEQQEARAAAGMEARELLGVLGRQLLARLVAGDRLVLRAVVLEDPLEVLHPRDEP